MSDKLNKLIEKAGRIRGPESFIPDSALKQTLNKMYDQAIEHAIEIVQSEWLGIDGDVMFKGKYTNEVFRNILNQLKSLKSYQGSDPPPIPDGVISMEGGTE